VRWEALQVEPRTGSSDGVLFARPAVVRTFDSPHFAGMTFFEVNAKSILNKVPAASRLPFQWTINPYRGCSHACRYCFARNTHTYLDLGAGLDFDTKVVVKVNAASLLSKELARRSWSGAPIAMGTNVDCYQRVEGRYCLMPRILGALTSAANPFSILTKGSLILRDLPLLQRAAAVTEVSTGVSVGFVDPALWRGIEPGAPSPRTRLEVCRALNDAGIRCGVLMAPILPGLTDAPEQLKRTVQAIAAAGARYVSPIVLHLRPGAREWFMSWLEATHPDKVALYRTMYARSSYAPKAYQTAVCAQVREFAQLEGIGEAEHTNRAAAQSPRVLDFIEPSAQLSLL
jgi:DNA repair photolyase